MQDSGIQAPVRFCKYISQFCRAEWAEACSGAEDSQRSFQDVLLFFAKQLNVVNVDRSTDTKKLNRKGLWKGYNKKNITLFKLELHKLIKPRKWWNDQDIK